MQDSLMQDQKMSARCNVTT